MVGMPGSTVLWLVYLLAFARLVLLITSDTITEGPRDRLVTALKERHHLSLAYLVLCPWCISIWLAFIASPILYAYGHNPWLFRAALVLALSGAAGVLARVKG
jgi:hypothetical protein